MYVLDLGGDWRWVISITLQPLYSGERAPGTHWIGSCAQTQSGQDGEVKILDLTATQLWPIMIMVETYFNIYCQIFIWTAKKITVTSVRLNLVGSDVAPAICFITFIVNAGFPQVFKSIYHPLSLLVWNRYLSLLPGGSVGPQLILQIAQSIFI
jgi:hypothetical protein